MELRTIRTFITITELGSFTLAAKKLGYTQSTITMQIKQLEEELQVPLFDRIGKRVHLTEKGIEFKRYADSIIKLSMQAKEAMYETGTPKGTLDVGIAESLSSAYLPKIMKDFREKCPDVKLNIISQTRPELFTKLKQNQLDLVFVLDEKITDPLFENIYEKEVEVVFIGPPNSPNTFELDTLIGEVFIATEKGFGYRQYFDNYLSSLSKVVVPALEIGNTEIIKSLVQQGLGYSYLPRFAVESEIQNNTLKWIDVKDLDIKIWSQLFSYKNRWLSPQMKIFIDLIKGLE